MRFRQWLEYGGGAFGAASGGGAITAMHGGIFGPIAGSHLNTGIKGMKSKYQTTSNDDEEVMDQSPDELFGFKSPNDKKPKERQAQTIDIKNKKSPMRVPVSYT